MRIHSLEPPYATEGSTVTDKTIVVVLADNISVNSETEREYTVIGDTTYL